MIIRLRSCEFDRKAPVRVVLVAALSVVLLSLSIVLVAAGMMLMECVLGHAPGLLIVLAVAVIMPGSIWIAVGLARRLGMDPPRCRVAWTPAEVSIVTSTGARCWPNRELRCLRTTSGLLRIEPDSGEAIEIPMRYEPASLGTALYLWFFYDLRGKDIFLELHDNALRVVLVGPLGGRRAVRA